MTSPTPSSYDIHQKTRECHAMRGFLLDRILALKKPDLSGEETRERHGRPKKSQTNPSVPTDKNSTIFISLSSLRREVSKNEDTATPRERERRVRERSNYTRQRKMSREGKAERGRRRMLHRTRHWQREGMRREREREKAMLSWRRSMEKKKEGEGSKQAERGEKDSSNVGSEWK